mgnify:CR=1 FL=1
MVQNKEDDMVIVDQAGNIVDDLADLRAYMETVKVEKDPDTMKHVGYVFTAGHLQGDTLYFASNYDTSGWKCSIWRFDLKSREIEKILSQEQYDHLSFLSVTSDGLLLESYKELDKAALVIERFGDGSVREHIVPGNVINASTDGTNISFNFFKDAGLLANRLGIYHAVSAQSVEIRGIPENVQINHEDVVWNGSGTQIAFVTRAKDSAKLTYMVYDLAADTLTPVSEPEYMKFLFGHM